MGTVSRTQGTTEIWVDGSLENTNEWDAGAAPYDNYVDETFHIGIHLPPDEASEPQYVQQAHATIDEVRIYDRALTEQEIGALYTNR